MCCVAFIHPVFLCSPCRPEPRGALRAGGHPQEEGCLIAGDPEAQGGVTGGDFGGRGTGDQYRGQVNTFLCLKQQNVHIAIGMPGFTVYEKCFVYKKKFFSAQKILILFVLSSVKLYRKVDTWRWDGRNSTWTQRR